MPVTDTNHTEEELISLLRKGDSRSYRFLVDRHKSYAYTLAFRIVGNQEDAQEVAQDAFVKAYNNISSFKGDSKFSTWLYRIVFNTAISRKRKKKLPVTDIEKAYTVFDEQAGSHEGLSHNERKQWLERAISNLAEDDSFLITLYYFQELSLEEIAEVTGFTPNLLKVKIFRARKKLADWLGKNLKEEITSLT